MSKIKIYPPFPFEITGDRSEIIDWCQTLGLTYRALEKTSRPSSPITLIVEEETRDFNKTTIDAAAKQERKKVVFDDDPEFRNKL